MPVTLSDPEQDQRVRRLLDHFAVDPGDTPAFQSLEEHLFLAGAWGRLAGVYEARLSVLRAADPQRAEVLLRLAELLAERLRDPAAARRRYEELLRSQPKQRRALAGLRRLHEATGDTLAALQVGELEEALVRDPAERAALLAQTGALWSGLGVADEARRRFAEAVELDPACEPAARGFAELAQREGRGAEAIDLYERRLRRLSGSARIDAQEQLAHLLGPDQLERQRALLREVVRASPQRRRALERLIELERAARDTARVDELQRALWRCLRDASERAQLALEAGTFQLEEARDLESALHWAQQAHSVAPADPRVHELRVRVCRRTGQIEPLLRALEEQAEITPPTPVRLLEIAALHARAGRPERSVVWLERLLSIQPGDPEALALLDVSLARLGKSTERAAVLEQRVAAAADPAECADLLARLGELCAAELDDAGAAEHAWRRALERSPRHARAAEQLAELLRKQERWSELARLLAERAEGEAGRAAAALHAERGQLCLTALADPDAARQAFLAALGADPRCAAALAGLHELARASGDAVLALDACERELAADPEPERRALLLGEVVQRAREIGDLPRARRAAQRWAEEEAAPQAWRALAEIARGLGDAPAVASALGRLDALLAEDPAQRATVQVELGELALERAEPDALERAAEHFAVALRLSPSRELRCRLADLYRRSGRLPELAEVLRAQLAAAPQPGEETRLRLELARALAELGDAESAIRELKPAFELEPANPDVADLLEALLGEQDRLSELVELLGRRLARDRDPERRRDRALQQAALLVEGLGRPADAVAVLRELADPSRNAPLERLFGEALAAAGDPAEREAWLSQREPHVEPEERVALLLELAVLQELSGASDAALASLQRAQRLASPEQSRNVRDALLGLLERRGKVDEQLAFLDHALAQALEPAQRVACRIERARLRIEDRRDIDSALADLEAAQADAPLAPSELRVVARLLALAGDPARQARALEQLAELAESTGERRAAALELAELRAHGPEGARDRESAERVLRRWLERDPADAEVFDRLAQLHAEARDDAALIALLRARLGQPGLREGERGALARRLAGRLLDLGRPAEALEVLSAAREAGAGDSALDELLFAAAAASGALDPQTALCRERARMPAPDRVRWLRRWLACLERTGTPAEARLEALDALLEREPGSLELLAERALLVREHAGAAELARTLERLLEVPDAARTRRATWLHELLDLYEGELGQPEAALALVEREAARTPELRARGARLAARVGDALRERRMLEPLVAETASIGPAWVRALALARVRCGAGAEAEPLLWAAFERDPRDASIVEALETQVRARGERGSLARVLEARFELASDPERAAIARELWQICDSLGEPARGLTWLRRACALGEPGKADLRAWLELERSAGDRLHALGVIDLLLAACEAPAERAELLAQQAELLEARGQLEAASRSWREAVGLCVRPPIEWLAGLERLAERLGQPAERAEWLARLCARDDLPAAERERCASARVELLASHPELRAEAALVLAQLVESGGPLSDPAQRARAERLLSLHDALGRDAEWCALAARLAAVAEPPARAALERERARRLAQRLGAREPAIAAWQAIRAAQPEDAEALDALLELHRRPGDEAQLASLLEARAQRAEGSRALHGSGGAGAAQDWIEAAGLRWRELGDAAAALADTERALALSPGLAAAHALRSELCEALDRPDAEAESLRIVLAGAPEGAVTADRWLRLAQLAAARPEGRTEAIEAGRRALEQFDGAALRTEVRRVFERCGAWHEAADLLRAELAGEPESAVESLRALARITWEELGDAAGAHAALETLAARAALERTDHERWAAVREALGDRAGAIEQRRRALELQGEAGGSERWLALARELLDLGHAQPALAACTRAISAEPRSLEAVELRAQIHRALGRPAAELDDCAMLGELLPDGAQRAAALARAGEIAAEQLGDENRAWLLHRSALRACSSWVPALLGAGAIAARRSEWSEAERMFGLACTLLPGTPDAERLPQVALAAAQAAEARSRFAEAGRYLELALEARPDDAEALDGLASVSLRLGAYERARTCLETRLAAGELAPEARADRLVKLAQAAEGCGALPRAAEALEEVIALRPDDEVWRARAVDLLERLGETARAVAQLEAWTGVAPAEDAPRLSLRAAQLELRSGAREAARSRLAAIAAAPDAPAAAFTLLAQLALEDQNLAAALEASDAGLARVAEGSERAALFWVRARALLELEQRREAVQCACEVLRFDPTNLEAARLVAAQLGQVGSFQTAVRQLERALDATDPAPAVRAELWEAIGRAYAGPLEDLERAQRCYRRALEANPLRASAREALADVTAFDPGHHRESLALHRELLAAHPARPGSWRSLARIAEHWRREESSRTCAIALEVLGADLDPRAERAAAALLVRANAPESPVIRAASEILGAFEEAMSLPSASAERWYAQAPQALQRELAGLAGEAWNLSDADLCAQWVLALEQGERPGEELPRRARRRLRAALETVRAEQLRALRPEEWRAALAAQAAARAIQAGDLTLEAALRALVAGWPATAHLRLREGQDPGPAIQLCPPARALLLRVADAAIERLGL